MRRVLSQRGDGLAMICGSRSRQCPEEILDIEEETSCTEATLILVGLKRTPPHRGLGMDSKIYQCNGQYK